MTMHHTTTTTNVPPRINNGDNDISSVLAGSLAETSIPRQATTVQTSRRCLLSSDRYRRFPGRLFSVWAMLMPGA